MCCLLDRRGIFNYQRPSLIRSQWWTITAVIMTGSFRGMNDI